jgi:enoyl-CoA hydratase
LRFNLFRKVAQTLPREHAEGEDLSVVRTELRDSALVVTVDRPETKNAVDPAVHDALRDAIDRAEADPEVRAVVLTGAGASFLSGGDLKFIREHPPEETLALSQQMTALLDRLEALPLLVIAAINGYAYGGGCEIAVACDYRIAEARAKLSFRQAAMGLTTGWGAATRLSRLVPRSTALRLLATAEVLDAVRAHQVGLVDEVVPDGACVERACALASEVALVSPRAVAGMKRVLGAAYGGTSVSAAVSARELEWEVFRSLWGGEDHAEALEAFFAKRPPRWS